MIKDIVYVQCQRWIIRLSFKMKAFGEFFMSKEKNFSYVKRILCIDKLFSILSFIFLINEEKEFKKKY